MMTKRFLSIFLPVTLLIGLVISFFYLSNRSIEIKSIKNKEQTEVEVRMSFLHGYLKNVFDDINYLAEYHGLRNLLDNHEGDFLIDLQNDLIAFSSIKRIYDQIRYIDAEGMEIVRVNYNNGAPSVVAEDELQSKSHRYYFKESFSLGEGKVYVSPFDLNIERGQVERPLKPMIRFARAIYDSGGIKKGILVLNYLGAEIVDHFKQHSQTSYGEISFLNNGGYWFVSHDGSDEWGFMFEERKERRFGKDFPGAWRRISNENSGQFINEKGLFTFSTIYPTKNSIVTVDTGLGANASIGFEHTKYYWKMVSRVPINMLTNSSEKLLRTLVIIYMAIIVLMAIISYLAARARELTFIDALTGIPNRRSHNRAIENEWSRAKRAKTSLSVIMVDIDYFKQYNDTLGHSAGDECLRSVAQTLQSLTYRPGDIVSRYGGEEFSVILPGADLDGASHLAEQMREKIESLMIKHAVTKYSKYITISLGVTSTIPDMDETPDTLVSLADSELYRAKDAGRNCVKVAGRA